MNAVRLVDTAIRGDRRLRYVHDDCAPAMVGKWRGHA
jgi:hypothetical protein